MKNVEKLSSILVGNDTLYNTSISEISIRKDDFNGLIIVVLFNEFGKKSKIKSLELVFSQVIEFSFYNQQNFNFLTVEDYKLLELSDGSIFFCLDPDDSRSDFSKKDGDYIRCNTLNFVIVNNEKIN